MKCERGMEGAREKPRGAAEQGRVKGATPPGIRVRALARRGDYSSWGGRERERDGSESCNSSTSTSNNIEV